MHPPRDGALEVGPMSFNVNIAWYQVPNIGIYKFFIGATGKYLWPKNIFGIFFSYGLEIAIHYPWEYQKPKIWSYLGFLGPDLPPQRVSAILEIGWKHLPCPLKKPALKMVGLTSSQASAMRRLRCSGGKLKKAPTCRCCVNSFFLGMKWNDIY